SWPLRAPLLKDERGGAPEAKAKSPYAGGYGITTGSAPDKLGISHIPICPKLEIISIFQDREYTFEKLDSFQPAVAGLLPEGVWKRRQPSPPHSSTSSRSSSVSTS